MQSNAFLILQPFTRIGEADATLNRRIREHWHALSRA
jgi:hypothetical protein